MQTRLSRICDAIIEAGWLAALVVTPLFFNTYSNRVFEPDKLHLLRSIALVMVVAWIVQLLDRDWRTVGWDPANIWLRIRQTPLVLPTMILIAAYLISTLLSVVPRISLVGSYVRMQGTFSFLSYAAIFGMVLTHLRSRAQVNRLIHTIVLSSLPISIHGIIQHYGLDPLPWGGNVTDRVAANMGNAIFVAAYLIMALFLTLERLLDSVASLLNAEQGSIKDALRAGGYLFVLAVQLIAIIFTQSRGPWLGLAAGLYVFGLLGVLLLGHWAANQPRAPQWLGSAVRPVWFALIGLTVAGFVFLIVLNIRGGPLENLREKPYIGRMATVLDTTRGTNAVRVLIWEGVVDMMLKPHEPIQYPDGTPDKLNAIRPLIGYGPESMWVAYNRFYPPDLAHFEARNASPDRSHNETFDALVRTGLIGFGAQIFLFGSIFYYALRWLGLMRGRGRRRLFLALLSGGAVLGVVIPWLADGSLRLAGVGLPVGLIIGVIIYVTLDVLLASGSALQAVDAPQVADRAISDRQQLLILAVFAAIVAHFVEVHFGIAIAATRTHFWTLAALLVVIGMGWADRPETAENTVVATAQPKRSETTRSTDRRRKRRRGKAGREAAANRGDQKSPAPRRASSASPLRAFLPYAGILAVVTLVVTWDYLVNQTGASGAFAILWKAFTARVDKTTYQIVRSPILVLLAFTWLVGGLFALTESAAQSRDGRRGSAWLVNAVVYLATALGVFLIYGLMQASRLQMPGLAAMEIFDRVAGHIAFFDACLLIVILGLAGALWLADPRPRPVRAFSGMAITPLIGGVVACVIALLIIVNVNIRTVQADTYYKQGLAYEGANSWESAAALYIEAAERQPQEDYYYLFLGRALLQLAARQETGTITLPDNLDNIKTADLLPLVKRGVRSRSREDLMRTSHAALVAARRLNPLNTDHSANLARHSRTWAFVNALGPNEAASNARLYQLVRDKAEGVDLARLAQSLAYYRQATMLSPNNAQLRNEMATIQFIQGDVDAAMETLDKSLALDQRYHQTYLLMAELREVLGDRQGALEAYREAAEIRPKDVGILSAVGVFSAQLGETDEALAAFQRIIDVESAALASAKAQLAELDARAASYGGYSRLLPTANEHRNALERSIASHRSQLHLSYRNSAIVLRDAGRLSEAITAAQAALQLANDSERGTTEALINELKSRSNP